MTEPKPMPEFRTELMLAILDNVAFDGWSNRALRQAIDASDDARAEIAFPGGMRDVLRRFSQWADDRMLATLAETEGFDTMRVRDKITLAVRTRLEILEPYREAVRRSFGSLVLPKNAMIAPGILYATVDAMWRAAGDTATDYNHYTKRGLLSGVVVSTLMFWLADRSEGHAQTSAFLDRQIETVLSVGKAIGGPIRTVNRVFEAPFRLLAARRRV